MDRGNENASSQSRNVLMYMQTNIETFSLNTLKDIANAYPLSEEQAHDLYVREQNGPGRKQVLRLFAVQLRKDAKRKHQEHMKKKKDRWQNLLDPKVSVMPFSVIFSRTNHSRPFTQQQLSLNTGVYIVHMMGIRITYH